MWETTRGNRTLAGAEAVVIRETIGELIDSVRAAKMDGESAAVGVGLFDQLHWQQQLAMLLKVARPLLRRSSAYPGRTALVEATVGAIYAQMLIGVEYEIETQQSSTHSTENDTVRRREIVAALREGEPDENWLDAECVVMNEWETAISILQDWVLPDEDWKMVDLVLDLPADQSEKMKAFTGIDADYFIDIPPDLDESVPSTVWADLMELTTGNRPDEQYFDK